MPQKSDVYIRSRTPIIWVLLKFASFAAVSFCTIALLILLLSFWSSRVDKLTIATSILASLEDGSLRFPPVDDYNLTTGLDTWDDCVAVAIATYRENEFIPAITSARFIVLKEGGTTWAPIHECIDIDRRIALAIWNHGESGGGVRQVQTDPNIDEFGVRDYWRYWWGSAALVDIAIGITGISLPSYQNALKLTTYSMIFFVAILALIRYRQFALLFIPVAFALAFGFGIPLFGQSIAQAPGLIVGLGLVSIYMAVHLDRAPLRWQFVYLFVSGGLGMYFDLFNGDMIAVLICFSMIRLLSMYLFQPPRLLWPGPAVAYPITTGILHLMTAYVSGAVSVALFRIILRAALLGQDLTNVVSEWYMEISKWSSDKMAEHIDMQQVLWNIRHNINAATFPYMGGRSTSLLYTFCAIIYVAIIIWLGMNWPKLSLVYKDRIVAGSLVVMVVPLEYCIFLLHDIWHFAMMGRLLSLFFALSFTIAFFAYEGKKAALA